MEAVRGWIPDFLKRRFFYGEVVIDADQIVSVKSLENMRAEPRNNDRYILPGLIDAHVHIESSMLVPSEFARQVVRYGTVGCVSDPHEIANVLGNFFYSTIMCACNCL